MMEKSHNFFVQQFPLPVFLPTKHLVPTSTHLPPLLVITVKEGEGVIFVTSNNEDCIFIGQVQRYWIEMNRLVL